MKSDRLAELMRHEAEDYSCLDLPVVRGGQGRDDADLAGWSAIACGLFLILGVLIGLGVRGLL